MLTFLRSTRNGKASALLLITFFITLFLWVNACCYAGNLQTLDNCNIVWDSPGGDMHGSMPLGNGDIGTNVWMEETGDLVFYISKTDSWGDNGRLLKIGRVRMSFSENLLKGISSYRQELDLKNGQMEITIDGDNPASLKFWVDANHPVIHITTASRNPLRATAALELWRTEQTPRENQVASPFHSDPAGRQPIVEPDTIVKNYPDGIAWYHRNIKSVGPEMTMKFQGLEDYPGFEDTLLHRTFGAVIKGENARRIDDLTIQCEGTNNRLSVYVLTKHPSTESQWLDSINATINETDKTSFSKRYREHCDWWNEFWDRSWIFANSTTPKATGPVPANTHSTKIGIDQHGSNKFKGQIGRVSIIRRALSPTEITKLSAAQSDLADIEKSDIEYSRVPELYSEIDNINRWTDAEEITLEAWINPEHISGGARIIDKITPGGSDGLLLDTWPGNGLRLIVGGETMSVPNCIKTDQWSHAAAVISSKKQRMELFLNGRIVMEQKLKENLKDAFVVTRAYNLQRFIDACASRGRFPVKFNGSIFTVDYKDDPDDRRWGQGYWWQNSRLPYISMAASGDFDLMQPLFRMYIDDILPLCRYRTKKYFGFDGAYFAECMYPWGAVFSQSYGWDKPYSERKDPLQRSGYHKWEWVAGPELVFMMQDYYDYTGDEVFLKDKLLPAAQAVIAFFDNYYKTIDGKLNMHPAQAVETWWDCTNPMPELAGLHAIVKRLIALPQGYTTADQRSYWNDFAKRLPDLPLRDTASGKALAPAERYDAKSNVENPELYGVFPFRHIAVGNDNIEWGINALNNRWDKGNFGWRQDDIFMAYLGLTDQAKDYLVKRARSYDKNSRFPAFWGPNYDWVPDQDHGGVLMRAFQAMVMQADPYSKKIYLLPAWPKDWDASFKLHAPYKTVIEGEIKNGKIENLKVSPKSRLKDIEIAIKSE